MTKECRMTNDESPLTLTLSPEYGGEGIRERYGGERIRVGVTTVAMLKLLIIEDDVDQRDLMRETLEDHFGKGCVTGVGTYKEAMGIDAASYDLILCDYNLPDGSGMDVLEEYVKHCSTPVLMVTGEKVGPIAAEAVRRGASDYVVKLGEYL